MSKHELLERLNKIRLENPSNIDRAYLLWHNLRLFITKQPAQLPATKINLINQCITSIENYRTATAAAAAKTQLTDGFLHFYWDNIESNSTKERDEVQALSEQLWYAGLAPLLAGKVTAGIHGGCVVVDVQNDFSSTALGGKSALPVTPSEDIAENINSVLFKIADPKLIVYTRDLHPADASWNQINPYRAFKPEHRFQLLDAQVIQKYPDCGHVCWGRHCTVNTVESDFIEDLALHPKALYVGKGTQYASHPYGAAVIENAILPAYFKSLNCHTVNVVGWATDYCVADTGKGLLAGGLKIVVLADCCGGIAPTLKKDAKPEDILKCFTTTQDNRLTVGDFANKINKLLNLKTKIVALDDAAYAGNVTVARHANQDVAVAVQKKLHM